MRKFTMGPREIGPDEPVWIVFEAGPTHTGVDSACELVRLAAKAGADAVKFQIMDHDRLVADKTQLFTYDVLVDRETGRTETVSEPLYDILARRGMSHADWRKVKAVADECKLAFFATVFFPEEVALCAEMNVHSLKIASADVNHLPLIRQAARTGAAIQLDTGSANIGEIEKAVDIICEEGNDRIIIHHCPSGYPARLESIHLNMIPTLSRVFPFPIAYSDHTPGWEMDVAAVAIGARLVEKTITLDRTTRSTEHMFSLEPPEMADFVRVIREVSTALGTSRRVLAPEERTRRMRVRRSVFLPEGGRQGQRLGDLPVDFRRPGDGVGPDEYERLVDLPLRCDLAPGAKLRLEDLG